MGWIGKEGRFKKKTRKLLFVFIYYLCERFFSRFFFHAHQPAHHQMQWNYDPHWQKFEIGVDEAGRGPLFGRLYTAAVILPHRAPCPSSSDPYDVSYFADEIQIKDSKKFSSSEKIHAAAHWIKQHAVAWNVSFIESREIDQINIRQSVLQSMRASIQGVVNTVLAEVVVVAMENHQREGFFVMVDGNDFPPPDSSSSSSSIALSSRTFIGGDNIYACIAAASILAKVSRDDYIHNLCISYPVLSARYQMHSNFGYGTKTHIQAIREFGITSLHRMSFRPCKDYVHDKDKILDLNLEQQQEECRRPQDHA